MHQRGESRADAPLSLRSVPAPPRFMVNIAIPHANMVHIISRMRGPGGRGERGAAIHMIPTGEQHV